MVGMLLVGLLVEVSAQSWLLAKGGWSLCVNEGQEKKSIQRNVLPQQARVIEGSVLEKVLARH